MEYSADYGFAPVFYTAASASDENLAYILSTCDNKFEDDNV